MAWDDRLDDLQKAAAGHVGKHARLLAGPGTGKSLVLARRVIKLVTVNGVDPQRIIALVFTRVNVFDLRCSIDREFKEFDIEERPKVRTLHSYALEQLLRNSSLITSLPKPLRIADDYEENEFILGDLYKNLGLKNRREAKSKFSDLAADWQSLKAAGGGYLPADPRFIGAWQEHRGIYGYVLRQELVWQLKRALEQYSDFDLWINQLEDA